MKKQMIGSLMIAALLCSTSCKDTKRDAAVAQVSATEAAPVAAETPADLVAEASQTIRFIYDEVFRTLDTDEYLDLDSRFCSSSLLDALRRCQERDDSYEIIGFDYWLQAQDFDHPSMKIQKAELLDDNKVQADLLMNDFGSDRVCRVVVVKENDQWKVDDFPQYDDEDGWFSFKQAILDSLSEKSN